MCKSMTIYSPASTHYTTYCIMLVEVWGIEPQLLFVILSRKTISLSLSPPINKDGRCKIPRRKEANSEAKHIALNLLPFILIMTSPIIVIYSCSLLNTSSGSPKVSKNDSIKLPLVSNLKYPFSQFSIEK